MVQPTLKRNLLKKITRKTLQLSSNLLKNGWRKILSKICNGRQNKRDLSLNIFSEEKKSPTNTEELRIYIIEFKDEVTAQMRLDLMKSFPSRLLYVIRCHGQQIAA